MPLLQQVRGVSSRVQKYGRRHPLRPKFCGHSFATHDFSDCVDDTTLVYLASPAVQHNVITIYPDFSVLQNCVPAPVRHRLRGCHPSALAIAPNGQYLAFHYDTMRSQEAQATMSVTRWPSGPTFHRMQQLSKPVLVTKGNFCFGFERCKGSIEKYNAVIRRVSDWSLIGQRPSGISRLCHIGDPKYSWEPEWHISGGLIIYLSRREMVFEVWDTFLRESRSMPGTPSGGIVKDLLTSPAGNVVIALYTDFKIYIWRNLTWKKLQGSIAHELRIFFVQDVAYLDRPTLNGLHLMMMDQRCRFLRYAQSHSKDQDPDEIRIGLFSDGTYVTRSQEQVPGGFASKYTIIANGAKQRAFYHYQAANYIWRTDSDAAIVLDTYIVTTGLGLVHFWSKAGKLVKSYRLGAKYEGCRGIALAGQHTVIAFDDRLTEATVWEFPRHDINDFASPTVPGRRYALE